MANVDPFDTECVGNVDGFDAECASDKKLDVLKVH